MTIMYKHQHQHILERWSKHLICGIQLYEALNIFDKQQTNREEAPLWILRKTRNILNCSLSNKVGFFFTAAVSDHRWCWSSSHPKSFLAGTGKHLPLIVLHTKTWRTKGDLEDSAEFNNSFLMDKCCASVCLSADLNNKCFDWADLRRNYPIIQIISTSRERVQAFFLLVPVSPTLCLHVYMQALLFIDTKEHKGLLDICGNILNAHL